MLLRAMQRTDQSNLAILMDDLRFGRKHAIEAYLDNSLAGIAVIQPTEYPLRVKLCVYAIAGERLDEWLEPGLEYLQQVAKQAGMSGLIAYCRPGLVPKLKAHGWQSTSTVMEIQC